MATAGVATEIAERGQNGTAGAQVRPERAEGPHRVAAGRVAVGIANYDRVAVRRAARV